MGNFSAKISAKIKTHFMFNKFLSLISLRFMKVM